MHLGGWRTGPRTGGIPPWASCSSGWSLKQPSMLVTLTSSGNSSTGAAARIRMRSANPPGVNTSPRLKVRPTRSSPALRRRHDREPWSAGRQDRDPALTQPRVARVLPDHDLNDGRVGPERYQPAVVNPAI